MDKRMLFENFNDKAYEGTTDPFGAIFEGPKLGYGISSEYTTNGDYEEDGEIGRANKGNPTFSSHSLSNSELEMQRERANSMDELDGKNTSKDALDHTEDIGEFDIAHFEDPEYGISGEEIIKSPAEPLEMDTDEQFGLDDPEGVIGDDIMEPEPPIETPASDLIALSNISDGELMKELQYRMANKVK